MIKKKYFLYGAFGLLLIGILTKLKKKSMFNSKLIDLALSEWKAWNIPTKIKEGSSKTIERLRNYYLIGTKTKASDNYYINTAWSANFISYLMRLAGAKDFKFSPSHSVYIVDAIKNKKQNNSKHFKGYKPNEVKITPGDLVCYPRQSGVNYDTVGQYASHCDLIVEVNETEAVGIGGMFQIV